MERWISKGGSVVSNEESHCTSADGTLVAMAFAGSNSHSRGAEIAAQFMTTLGCKDQKLFRNSKVFLYMKIFNLFFA